ncbi:hypothetical protein WMY93_005093 [Mugilogobius chulae]|uniref:Uncharacterized protein n=1 Tax=Mugilogobius chulae TaxID=88201 RepID=A0AAW0PRI7_9GOBI
MCAGLCDTLWIDWVPSAKQYQHSSVPPREGWWHAAHSKEPALSHTVQQPCTGTGAWQRQLQDSDGPDRPSALSRENRQKICVVMKLLLMRFVVDTETARPNKPLEYLMSTLIVPSLPITHVVGLVLLLQRKQLSDMSYTPPATARTSLELYSANEPGNLCHA